jgi:cytidyltransferase-like protein
MNWATISQNTKNIRQMRTFSCAGNEAVMKKAIYPGSFDPVTFGHMDIIERSSKIVDELVIGVLNNSAKNSLFSLDERV